VSNLLVDYGQVLLPVLAQPLARASTIALLVLAYMFINIRGIRQTSAVNTVFTVAKLVPLFTFAAVGLFFIEPRALHLGALPSTGALSTAILLAAFAFFGFDSTTILAGEVREPQRSVPFAILLSVSIVIVLYTLIQIVCVGTLPGLAASERPLSDAATLFAGPWASIAVAVTAVVACAGVYGASVTPATRLVFAMADHQQLPATLAQIHPRLRTPVPAIVATSIAALVLALSGSFIYLVKITLIARVTIYAITCLTLPLLRRRTDVPEAVVSIPGASVIACVCALLCVAFLVKSSMRELLDVGLGVLLGLAISGLTRRRSRSPVL
jgi:amino acid transporter